MLSKKIFQKSLRFLKVNSLEKNSFKYLLNNVSKFNFSRQGSSQNKSVKPEKISKESDENVKTINVIKEDIPMKINPYFSKGLIDKDKVNLNVPTSNEDDEFLKASGFRDILSKDQKDQVIKSKQKLSSAKGQKSKTIGVIVENIKRELPKEL
jgi:hypothetical protein